MSCTPHTRAYHAFDPVHVEDFRSQLVRWYADNRRSLPWRGDAVTRNAVAHPSLPVTPYGVWVSEVMLQQTRVETVIDYWLRWMARFPTVEALASASIEDVNSVWAGLGYYRRAKFLHEAAQSIIEHHGGQLPDTVKSLLTIKGIGEYTAGAIASIAFNKPEPIVDGNVIRVMSRVRAIDADPKDKRALAQHWQLAKLLVDPGDPSAFNQGMMELGATICTPLAPECDRCPVRSHCRAYQESRTRQRPTERRFQLAATAVRVEIEIDDQVEMIGESKTELVVSAGAKRKRVTRIATTSTTKTRKSYTDTVDGDCDICDKSRSLPPVSVTEYPAKAEKKAPLEQHVAVCVVIRRCAQQSDAYLLVKRPDDGLLAGLWEFPSVIDCEEGTGVNAVKQRQQSIDQMLSELFDRHYQGLFRRSASTVQRSAVGDLTHVFSHRKHLMHVERMIVKCSDAALFDSAVNDSTRALRWATQTQLDAVGLTTGVKKVLALVLSQSKPGHSRQTTLNFGAN